MLHQGSLQRRWADLRAEMDIRRRRRNQAPRAPRPFRVGLIGLGRIARRHAWGYLRSGKAVLAAGADPDLRQLKKAGKKYGIARLYEDYRRMLSETPLDLVSICTPVAFHAGAVLAAAEAGVGGILCEKPLCATLEEADQVLGACERAGVRLSIGHQRRFSPQHRWARQLLAEGILGPIHSFSGQWPRDTLRSGIHVADFLRFYIGEVASVVAQIEEDYDKPISIDLNAMLHRGLSGGRRGAILVRFEDKPTLGFFKIKNMPITRTRYHFLGERGEMEVWCNGGMRLRRASAARWETPRMELNPQWLEFQLEIESLMAAVRNHHPPEVSGLDGRKSLEITMAILQSAIEDREIFLPLQQSPLGKHYGGKTASVHSGLWRHSPDPRHSLAATG